MRDSREPATPEDVLGRRVPADAAFLDVSDLPAPEPFERIVLAMRRLAPGEVLWARTPRVPRVLLERLPLLGLAADVEPLPDGTALLRLTRTR